MASEWSPPRSVTTAGVPAGRLRTQPRRARAQAYPALEHAALGETKLISYPARDGTFIPASRCRPARRTGPACGDPAAWRSRNRTATTDSTGSRSSSPRAGTPCCSRSSGLDRIRRESAGYRNGVVCRTTSATACVIIDNGTANPARICIAGLSYGGYSALCRRRLHADLYACAISVNGVADRRNAGGPENPLRHGVWITPATGSSTLVRSVTRTSRAARLHDSPTAFAHRSCCCTGRPIRSCRSAVRDNGADVEAGRQAGDAREARRRGSLAVEVGDSPARARGNGNIPRAPPPAHRLIQGLRSAAARIAQEVAVRLPFKTAARRSSHSPTGWP
ncbi:MAG: prolyl oligopeptidase family serine peptidase [Proteobacteria bacterium]|nr:prolyl oligopeptidase family serine peptidase [Pseudomonadota bacterium]